MNNKKIIITGTILLFSTIFSYIIYDKAQEETKKYIKSTDLFNITIDSMKIGDKVNWNNLEKYTYQSRYKYKELTIDLDKNENIIYLFTYFNKKKNPTISINGNKELKTINDITKILGKNYNTIRENDETQLNKRVYSDKKNKITTEIIYNKKNKKLYYIKLIDSSLK